MARSCVTAPVSRYANDRPVLRVHWRKSFPIHKFERGRWRSVPCKGRGRLANHCHRRTTMRFVLPVLALIGLAAAAQTRQSSSGITVTPFSDFRDQTSYEGAESPNGKFFVTADLAGNFVRFNRATRRWDSDSTIHPWQTRWSPDGR